jgi:hypothetical protein
VPAIGAVAEAKIRERPLLPCDLLIDEVLCVYAADYNGINRAFTNELTDPGDV